jgi:hypothetical protein
MEAALRNLGGRPPHAPTVEQRHCVQVLAGNGVSHKVIAKLLRVSRNTLKKAYKAELADAREVVVATLGFVLVDAAIRGDWRAGISWLSRFGGPAWRKTERREHGGLEGAPIQLEARARVVIVPSDGNLSCQVAAAAAGTATAGVLYEDDSSELDEACAE